MKRLLLLVALSLFTINIPAYSMVPKIAHLAKATVKPLIPVTAAVVGYRALKHQSASAEEIDDINTLEIFKKWSMSPKYTLKQIKICDELVDSLNIKDEKRINKLRLLFVTSTGNMDEAMKEIEPEMNRELAKYIGNFLEDSVYRTLKQPKNIIEANLFFNQKFKLPSCDNCVVWYDAAVIKEEDIECTNCVKVPYYENDRLDCTLVNSEFTESPLIADVSNFDDIQND